MGVDTKTAIPAQYDQIAVGSAAVAQLIRNDMVKAFEKLFDNELYCILRFIGCSIGTHTVKARKTFDPASTILLLVTIMDVLVANKFAMLYLVVGVRTVRMLDEHGLVGLLHITNVI